VLRLAALLFDEALDFLEPSDHALLARRSSAFRLRRAELGKF
jgi:hypothetical protein